MKVVPIESHLVLELGDIVLVLYYKRYVAYMRYTFGPALPKPYTVSPAVCSVGC